MDKQLHNENIKKQFSKQATSYTAVAAHRDSLELLIEMADVSKEDIVLDIACGSGIVTCEFAKYAHHVTGIDITKGMLDEAEKLQLANNLTNINWILDDVVPLQFFDNQFSIVVTRFSFHHFIDYEKVFDEMIRVCKTNGTIMVVDAVLPNEKVNKYDQMEKIRDSSHAGVLTGESFDALFQASQIKECKKFFYEMPIELETQLNASYLSNIEKEKLRLMITQDVDKNDLGISVNRIEGKYYLHYPICIYVGKKA
ncbi:methyltransferase type 11 [Flavobacterium aquariorum]|uniref:Methyltransferase type 11 n=1 Tax=Flavobacterium aquariorum TaxID=2217670 RepID=A0A2W7UAT3_9FLAO|nr:class I SAM-dependent methyltransferase [Flavobacterium aquariorum]PZX94559.1 methyltransferase type 11 [Flavobacterium aquariorum]